VDAIEPQDRKRQQARRRFGQIILIQVERDNGPRRAGPLTATAAINGLASRGKPRRWNRTADRRVQDTAGKVESVDEKRRSAPHVISA